MEKNAANGRKSLLALLIVLSMIIAAPVTVFTTSAKGGGTVTCSDISPIYINASSDFVGIIGFAAQTNYIEGAGAYLDRVYVNFSGAGFTTSDLNPLLDGATTGVSIWADSDNPSDDGNFNSEPDIMLIPSSIKWTGNQARLTLPRSIDTQFTDVDANFTFYIVIQTSSTITDNDIIIATIDRIWVNASNATLSGVTTATVIADTSSPTVAQNALIAPNGGEKWSGARTISWNQTRITDSHLLANPITLYYSSDGGTTWTLIAANEANDGSYSWDTTTADGDGSNYKVNITAIDGAGKIGYDISNAIFQIDNTLPSCSIAYNQSSTYFKDGTKLKIYANFTEDGSGINESTVKISIEPAGNGGLTNQSMSKTSNTHWYYDWTIPSGSDDDGVFTVKIWARDNASNYLNPYPMTNATKRIDNTAPICSIEYNRSKTYFKAGDAIKIYANFTETGSGINESSVKINIDTAGNGGLANTSMSKTDSTHWYYGWMFPSGSDDDGTVTVKIWSHDNISNYVNPYPTTNTTKKIDNTRPTCAIGYNRSAFSFNAGTKLKIYANFTELGSGINSSSVLIGITTAGDGTLSPIAMSQTSNTRWYYAWTVPTGSDDDGVFFVSIWAFDNESNQLNPGQTTDSSKIIDNTAPTCTIAYNRSALYFKEGDKLKVYANFTESGSGMNESTLKINFITTGNGDLANTSMTKIDYTHWYYGWTIPTGSDDDGTMTVKIWARDNASNLLSPYPTTSTTRQIDNTVPSVPAFTLTFPNGGEQISGTQTIKWANGDIIDSHLAASPITLYYSNNGGGSWIQIATGEVNDGVYSWNTGSLADGSNYKIKVLAADQARNVANDTSDTTFTIDNTPPTCSIGYNRTETFFKDGTKIKYFANFTEAISGMNETTIIINISTPGNGDLFNTTLYRTNNRHWYYNWTIPSGVDDDGTCIVKIYAKDNASNNLDPYPTTNITKHIDNTYPTSAVDTIISHYHDTSTYLTINASASDVLSGLDTVSLFFYNSTDNFTWTGPYKYAINTTPWHGVTWNYSFLATNGSGYYRFYSVATDNATNTEAAPITNDSWVLYNFTNSPPNASKNPSPINGATDVSTSVTLSWISGGDSDGNTVSFNVYFGTDSTPDTTELKTWNQTATTYNPGTLSGGTIYYWMILSRDNHSIGTVGPTWSFTTTAAPQNPSGGGTPYPETAGPIADAGGPYSRYVNETIIFDGSKSTEISGSIVGYRWDFTNDGIYDTEWLTGATRTHIYTHIGTYTVKLQVKDNRNATDDDTASVTIKPLTFIKASQDSLTEIQTTFGLNLTTSFYATDTNGDGIVDSFTDPNHLLTLVRFVNMSGNASFLLSTGNDMIPEFFWDTNANKTVLLTFISVILTETWIDPEAEGILIVADVEKSGWVYIKIIDPYPPDKYPNFPLTVKTTNDRIISSNMIWRENGNIYILDDPSVQYILTYGYTILPPVFNPQDGTILSIARPTITITFFEETILAIATFENNNILDQLTTMDHKTFIFTPASDLVDGTYTLSLTVQDTEGNTLKCTSMYTISIVKISTKEIPWLIITFIAIILLIGVILVFLRMRLIL